MNTKAHAPKGTPLPAQQRTRLLAAVQTRGELPVLKAIGCSRNAMARAMAGLPVYAGTAALVAQALARIETDDVRARQFEEMARAQESR